VKDGKMIAHASGIWKQTGVAMLISATQTSYQY
jgi:hypothetical protein